MSRCPASRCAEIFRDALPRVVRAAEFVQDGEVEEALQTLLDLEHELRDRLRGEAAA